MYSHSQMEKREAGFTSLHQYGTRHCGSGVVPPQMVYQQLVNDGKSIRYVPLCTTAQGCIQQYNSNEVGQREMQECQRMIRQKTFQDE